MAVLVLSVAVLDLPGAAPAAGAQQPEDVAPSPQKACRIDDPTLAEASGVVADDGKWYVVNDGGSDVRVHVLDRNCAVSDVLTDPADPYDIEDLASASDGTFWLADIGDNRAARDTVALHEFRAGQGSTLYRLTYPDGAHDAEALILDGNGAPHIVTKSMTGTSSVYRPAQSLRSPGPTPLEKVGTVTVSPTATPGGPVGAAGSLLVTGGAMSHDGRVVALRTYTDAYLYPAPDGDVVAALDRDPVRVPLPNEPQGEAIAFQADGTLVSVSEGVGNPVRVLPGSTKLVRDFAADGTAGNDPGAGSEDGAKSTGTDGTRPEGARGLAADRERQDGSSISPVAAIGATGAVLAVMGAALVALRRRRR